MNIQTFKTNDFELLLCGLIDIAIVQNNFK